MQLASSGYRPHRLRGPLPRAALALAKLYQSTARPTDAHAVLTPALEGFAPTSEFPEIGEAHALLAALDNAGVNLAAGLSAGS